MRTREEILDLESMFNGPLSTSQKESIKQTAILEVLLDIRDLLTILNNK